MKKAKSETSKSDAVFSGNFTETITAVQKALAEAISFDMLGPEEVVAIKSSLSELGSGNLRVLPFGVTRTFEEFLIRDIEVADEIAQVRTALDQAEVPPATQKDTIVKYEIGEIRKDYIEEVEEVHAELDLGEAESS